MKTDAIVRRRLLAGGQVQGVGFRPFVYRLALEHGLTGSVGNTSDGVCIEIQGTPDAVDAFTRILPDALPPLARLTLWQAQDISPLPDEGAFHIIASTGHSGHSVLVSPDVATCPDCQIDIRDVHGRRHLYPFTNCTNCGPRYTITRTIPYDRASTSMACFPLCPHCQTEYDTPLDRRFHAQPNACPVCGPHVWVWEGGEEKGGEEAIQRVAQALAVGRIVAIKGLGGFHLACDARNTDSVAQLRRRKGRPHKPLAVMVRDIDMARTLAHISPEAETLLTGPERPIVLCPLREGALSSTITPDSPMLGLMLPYTPLHMILLDRCVPLLAAPPVLVMTSGNAGGEPICLGNREALRRLAHIADIFLLHNRDILVRADDSVVMPLPPHDCDALDPPHRLLPALSPLFFRRARGYVPRPVALAGKGPCVLGTGAELKATLCLTRADAAFVSQHVGDLGNLETLGFYEEVAAHLEMLLEVPPQAVVCDLHPDFLSTRFAEELTRARGVPLLRVQHHVAHGWSVLTENGHVGQALVLALDGTGLGEDGSIWGGELLWLDTARAAHKRVGRLSPFALPGGEAAIREPWRIAQGLLADIGSTHRLAGVEAQAAEAVTQMVRRNIRCVPTSSAGRLFDAVAALLGLCRETTYEGQAAIQLEAAQSGLSWSPGLKEGDTAPVMTCAGLWELDTRALFANALEDSRRGVLPGLTARRFHVGLAVGLADMAALAARETDVRVVGLSGGVMLNATLVKLLPYLLRQRGLTPLLHRNIPAHDGGVSLGQAAWGRVMLQTAPVGY